MNRFDSYYAHRLLHPGEPLRRWSSPRLLNDVVGKTGPIGFDVGKKVRSACWRLLLRLPSWTFTTANDNGDAFQAAA